MKTVKIFLASSINDLKSERMEISSFICCTLQKAFGDNVKFLLEMCEDDLGMVSKERKQEQYNQAIRESDYLFIMFWHNAGEFTVEEFRTAYEHFKEHDKPRILPFVKLLPEGDQGTASLDEFLRYMRDEIQHYYLEFQNIDTVKLRILLALSQDPERHTTVELRDQQVMVNNCQLTDEDDYAAINVDNIPFYRNHEGITRLRTEVAVLEEQKSAARMAVAESPNDQKAWDRVYSISAKWNKLLEELHAYEMQLLETSIRLTKRTESGAFVTARTKKAIDLFEEGKIADALSALDTDACDSDIRHAEEIAARNRTQLEALVNELTTRIDILSSQGPDAGTVAEIRELYERVKQLTLEHGLNLNHVQKYMNYLRSRKEYGYALEVGERLYHLYRGREDTSAEDWAGFCNDLAVLFNDVGRQTGQNGSQYLARSAELYEESLQTYRNTEDSRSWVNRFRIVFVGHKLADVYYETYRFKEAETLFLEVLDHAQHLARLLPSDLEKYVALTANSLANLYHVTGRHSEAEELYVKSAKIYRRMAITNPDAYESSVALVCNNYAILLQSTQRPRKAETMYKDALRIRRRLAAINPAEHELDLAATCKALAGLYHTIQRYTDAEALYQEALRIYGSYMEQDPVRCQKQGCIACTELAGLYIDIYCVNSAAGLLSDVILGYQKLGRLTGEDFMGKIKTIQTTQQALHRKMKTMEGKEQELAYAIRISHGMLAEDVTVFDTGLGKNYFYLYNIYRDSGRTKEAAETREAMARDAVSAYRRLAATEAPRQGSHLADTLLARLRPDAAEAPRYGIRFADAAYYLGDLLTKDDEAYEEGISLYREAVQAYRSNRDDLNDISLKRYATACYEAAVSALMKESYEDAEQLYTEAYSAFGKVKDMNPDARAVAMMMACYHLGVVYEDLEDDEKADEAYDKALDLAAAYKDVNPDCAEMYEKLKD